jgi:hypothetical protein
MKRFIVAALTLLTVGGSGAIDCPAHPRISDYHDPEMLRRCNSYWESNTSADRAEPDHRASSPYFVRRASLPLRAGQGQLVKRFMLGAVC